MNMAHQVAQFEGSRIRNDNLSLERRYLNYIFLADEQCTMTSSGNVTLRIDAPEVLMFVGNLSIELNND